MSRVTLLAAVPSRWRRVLMAAALSGFAATVAVLGLSTPAAAHGQFVSADPAPNTEVPNPLASILIYFTEKPASNAYFAVTAPSGVRVDRLWSHGTPRRLDEPVHEWYHNDDGRLGDPCVRGCVPSADPDRVLAGAGRLQGQLRVGGLR